MRRFPFVLLFFVIGVFPQSFFGQNKQMPKKVNYCDLFDESKDFEGQTIQSQALMAVSTIATVDGAGTFFYSPECNNKDFFAETDFTNLSKQKRWDKYFNLLKPERKYRFEINFTGKIKSSPLFFFGHLGSSRAEIKVLQIESIKDATSKVEEPDSKTEAIFYERAKRIQEENSKLMQYLVFLNVDTNFLNSILDDNFVFTDFNGKSIGRKNFLALQISPILNKIPIFKDENSVGFKTQTSTFDSKTMDNQVKVFSFIKLIYPNKTTRKINVKTIYQFNGKQWKIVVAEITE